MVVLLPGSPFTLCMPLGMVHNLRLQCYSCLPISRAGPNKRAGWNFIEKKLNEQGLISEQGGIYDEIGNRAGQVSPLYQYKELQTFSIYIVNILRYVY